MPTPPKLRYIPGEIRILKVLHKVYAKQPGTADRYIRVSGKIPVNLYRKEESPQKQGTPIQRLVILKHTVHEQSAVIGNHHFLEKSPKHLAYTIQRQITIEITRPEKLREQMGSPFYRARH